MPLPHIYLMSHPELCLGNIGAAKVLSMLSPKEVVMLERTDLKGSEIWVEYKDNCEEDIYLFKLRLINMIYEKGVV